VVGEQIKNLQLREGLVVITSRDKAPHSKHVSFKGSVPRDLYFSSRSSASLAASLTPAREQKSRISLRIIVQLKKKKKGGKTQHVVTLSL
jgi:hypothetical protein